MTHYRPLDEINRSVTSTGSRYIKTNLGITSDEETNNLISGTFGQFIKNNLEAIWYGLGLDPNVTNDIAKIINDPNMGFENNGRRYIPHSAVGNMRPHNADGMPTYGCFTMTALA